MLVSSIHITFYFRAQVFDHINVSTLSGNMQGCAAKPIAFVCITFGFRAEIFQHFNVPKSGCHKYWTTTTYTASVDIALGMRAKALDNLKITCGDGNMQCSHQVLLPAALVYLTLGVRAKALDNFNITFRACIVKRRTSWQDSSEQCS
jgi:hypothetical protein